MGAAVRVWGCGFAAEKRSAEGEAFEVAGGGHSDQHEPFERGAGGFSIQGKPFEPAAGRFSG